MVQTTRDGGPSVDSKAMVDDTTTTQTVASASDVTLTAEPPVVARPAETRRSIASRAWRFVKRLVILAVFGALSVGAWLAWPDVYERYIAPIDTNTVGLGAVENDLAATNERLVTAEATIEELNTQLQELQSASDATGSLVAANGEATTLLETAQATANERIDALENRAEMSDDRIAALTEQIDALGTDIATATDETASQLKFVTAVQLLSRARLFLYQANYGLAESDVATARALLAPEGEAVSDVRVTAAVERLDRVIDALPTRPVLAAAELDIAWDLLLSSPGSDTNLASITDQQDASSDDAAADE